MAAVADGNNPAGTFFDGLFDFGRDVLKAGIEYKSAKNELDLARAYTDAQRMQATQALIEQERSSTLAGIHPAVWVAAGLVAVGLFAVFAMSR